jgi:hypothetical protein
MSGSLQVYNKTETKGINMKLNKVVRPGMVNDGVRSYSIFCKVKIKEEHGINVLSISGVEGPMVNGNARGSCGQINMCYKHSNPEHDDKRYGEHKVIKVFADGWTSEKWFKFLEIWNDWHLNDMRSYCNHQKDLGWRELLGKEVNLYHWNMKSEWSENQKKVKGIAIECAKNNTKPELTDEQRLLLALDYSLITHTEKVSKPIAKYYEPHKPSWNGDKGHIEKKTLGWLRPEEHPDGLLCRPCPSCGYKYGADHRKEDLPKDVIDFLTSLPDTDRTPAWV